jgi:hypothetical protein
MDGRKLRILARVGSYGEYSIASSGTNINSTSFDIRYDLCELVEPVQKVV